MRSAQSARSYEGMESPAKPSAAIRSRPRASSITGRYGCGYVEVKPSAEHSAAPVDAAARRRDAARNGERLRRLRQASHAAPIFHQRGGGPQVALPPLRWGGCSCLGGGGGGACRARLSRLVAFRFRVAEVLPPGDPTTASAVRLMMAVDDVRRAQILLVDAMERLEEPAERHRAGGDFLY